VKSMTERVLDYQRSREGLRAILSDLAPTVYQFPRRRMGLDEDACGDFYVFVHPRLLRLLDRFRDLGKPFESYLWAVLNWQLKNFARERRRSERAWSISLSLEPSEPEESPGARDESCLGTIPAAARCVRSDADKRNFLFLVLKCARLIEPANAASLAAVAGITASSLLALAGRLADVRAPRLDRLETFRCRRNNAFSRIRLLEAELPGETDASRIEALTAALTRERRRMQSALHRMSRVAVAPTNREIAELLSVPKGTVDSGIFLLKRKLGSVYDPDILRSA
jgi:DNA-directed RNA polymerase specialized sigma24 family protein